MLVQLLLWLWATVLNFNVVMAEFQPKVTRSSGPGIFFVDAFDDSKTLLKFQEDGMFISFDNGGNWQAPDGIDSQVLMGDIDENYRHDRAVVNTVDGQIYLTENQGKSWKRLNLPINTNEQSYCVLDTHPKTRDYFLLRCTKCNNENSFSNFAKLNVKSKRSIFAPSCQESSYVSDNGGKKFRKIESPKHVSSQDTEYLGVTCKFLYQSTETTLSANEDIIYCLDSKIDKWFENEFAYSSSGVLFYTDNFGKTTKVVDQFKDVAVTGFQILNSHLLVYTLGDKFNMRSAANLWVSNDGFSFAEAFTPTVVRFIDVEDALEDSLGRIILLLFSIGGKTNTVSQILISDSSGLKFSTLTITPEDTFGFSMLELSKNLKGTIWADFMSIRGSPQNPDSKINELSKISTNNGETWSNLRVVVSKNRHNDLFKCDINDVEHCSLHKFFGDPMKSETAGIQMTLGTVGDGSENIWEDLMTFISRDGGVSWEVAFEYPCMFAFGDLGNVIIAMPFFPDEDGDPRAEFYYSLDQGKTWKEYQLEVAITPTVVMSTTPDASGLNFIISSFNLEVDVNESTENFFYTIDFSEAFNGEVCGTKDFETWYLAGGECVNGAKYSYNRRKQDSQCLVRKLFEDLKLKEEVCDQCTEKDYECSFEFTKTEDGKCKPDLRLLSASSICEKSDKDTVKLNPITKLPGSKCQKELQVDPVEISCGFTYDAVMVTENSFKSKIQLYQYFDTNQDESLIIDTVQDGIYISHDSGQIMKKFDPGEDIVEIVFNPYHDSYAYLFGASGRLYVTDNRGKTFRVNSLPHSRQLGLPLEFHAKNPDIFVYYGGKDCENMFNPSCHPVAYITMDGGKSFTQLLDNAIHCEFAGSLFKHPIDENLIYCQIKEPQTRRRSLISSTDFFHQDKKVVLDKIIGYMNTGEFIVVAVPYGENELRAYVTVDGAELAEAKFPWDLTASKQEAFTVLGSETGSIFFHLTTFDKPGYEYGALLKSNSNGTSFVKLQSAVNRNSFGMVDFEKIQGLEGIILINVVDNFHEVETKSDKKKLKSMITFNDGSDWSYIQAPLKDSSGKSYGCNTKQAGKCSLHLHGYTEREDVRDTFFSGSAFGMLVGVGNVGEYLLPEDQCSTFFSKDGGETWHEIKKGAYQWEFGDHGGIIVLVPKNGITNTLTYSIDMGKTWRDYHFTNENINVQDIVTVPKDSALRFLLIGSPTSVNGGATKTFSIDFSGIFKGQCSLNPEKPDSRDFRFFSLGKSDSKCLFGHQARYLMKDNPDCFVGNMPLSEFYEITKNCTCTRADFECDYNYYKSWDGTCKLVEGLSPVDPADICKKEPELIEYFQPTGYRKIPLSTCEGGLRLDDVSSPLPCPGKEREFNEKYGFNSKPYLFTFLIFFFGLLAIMWFIYDRGIRRNGGFARFGEIRLDGDDLIENNKTDKIVNSIVRSGFYAASATFSVYQLFKRSIGRAAWKLGEKFGRRRGPTYSSLLHDQFIDEADDLLTGHDEDANDLGNFLANQGNFEIEDEDNEVPSIHAPFTDEPPPRPEETNEQPKSSELSDPVKDLSSSQQNINDEEHNIRNDEQDLGI